MEDCAIGFRDQARKSITSAHFPLLRIQPCGHMQEQGRVGKGVQLCVRPRTKKTRVSSHSLR